MRIFGSKKNKEENNISWIELTKTDQIDQAIKESYKKTVLFFKHSTRCSISMMILNRLEQNWRDCDIKPYYLDLLAYRTISDSIETKLAIIHQSPQAILIKNGQVIYHESHNGINFVSMLKHV